MNDNDNDNDTQRKIFKKKLLNWNTSHNQARLTCNTL